MWNTERQTSPHLVTSLAKRNDQQERPPSSWHQNDP
uniref:Uncharacterized protein n=1 Tax=Arundo donax TaxID=35708 RepID=A0A0A9B256_ARUDO